MIKTEKIQIFKFKCSFFNFHSPFQTHILTNQCLIFTLLLQYLPSHLHMHTHACMHTNTHAHTHTPETDKILTFQPCCLSSPDRIHLAAGATCEEDIPCTPAGRLATCLNPVHTQHTDTFRLQLTSNGSPTIFKNTQLQTQSNSLAVPRPFGVRCWCSCLVVFLPSVSTYVNTPSPFKNSMSLTQTRKCCL